MSGPPGKIATAVMQRFPDQVPPEKRAAKIRSAKWWWAGAGVFMLVALLFVGAGFYVAATRDMTLVLAVLLGMFIVLPGLGALFCANKASGEATAAFVGVVTSLARIGRGAVKGNH